MLKFTITLILVVQYKFLCEWGGTFCMKWDFCVSQDIHLKSSHICTSFSNILLETTGLGLHTGFSSSPFVRNWNETTVSLAVVKFKKQNVVFQQAIVEQYWAKLSYSFSRCNMLKQELIHPQGQDASVGVGLWVREVCECILSFWKAWDLCRMIGMPLARCIGAPYFATLAVSVLSKGSVLKAKNLEQPNPKSPFKLHTVFWLVLDAVNSLLLVCDGRLN